jgi:molecular chaperone DnaK
VTFDIDANGIVNVSAKDKATSKEQQIRIQASGGLSDADVQRMVKDAEAHAADDKKRRAVVEARNHADALIHESEKQLKEHGDKIGAGEKQAIETAIAELKSVKDGDDAEAITAKTNALRESTIKMGEAMYKAAQQAGAAGAADGETPGGATNGSGGAKEGVVDADFEEVDENRKGGGAA